jgi:ERF superfamily.
MNAVAEKKEVQPVETLPLAPVASESAAILSVIERMATNPDIDPDRIARFIALKERMDKEAARKAFAASLALMQAEMPVIEENGRIEVRKKDARTGDRTGEIQQSTTYALWEDINEAIRPVLKAHGFALMFRTGQTPEGKITVTGILSHRDGHQEETTISLMHDSTGSKNAVQAMGSSISYGKRYTASALLNITSRGEDDDGEAGGKLLSKADAREPYKAMQDELDACATLEQLQGLWTSPQFRAAYEQLPNDWKKFITERKDELKAALSKPDPNYVAPSFDGFPAE